MSIWLTNDIFYFILQCGPRRAAAAGRGGGGRLPQDDGGEARLYDEN